MLEKTEAIIKSLRAELLALEVKKELGGKDLDLEIEVYEDEIEYYREVRGLVFERMRRPVN